MRYWAALLLAAALWTPILAANPQPTPPATPTPNMHVQETSNGVALCTVVNNMAAEFGRACPPALVGQLSPWVKIRITNEDGMFGSAVLNLTTPVVTTGGNDFTVATGAFNSSLQVGGSTEFWISCSPQSAGVKTGQVTFSYEENPYVNPGVYADFVINVTGLGVASPVPVINVLESFPLNSTKVYHDLPAVGGRNFGKRKLSAGATESITIGVFNAGAAGAGDLHIGTPAWISGNNQFELDLTGFTGTLSPTYGTLFTVRFDPFVAGVHTAVLEFTQDDGFHASPFRIEFKGEGIVESDQVRVSDSTGPWFDNTGMVPQYIGTHLDENAAPAGPRNFGTVDGGNTATFTLTIANADVGDFLWTGYQPGADLTLGTPTLVGHSDFSLDLTGFSTTVTSAGTVSFTVRFSPLADGVRSAVLEIPHSDGSEREPFRVNLTGIGQNASSGGGTVGSGGASGGGGGAGCSAGHGSAWWLLFALGALVPALLRRRAA